MLPSEAFNASHYKITAKVLSALLAEQHLQTEIWGQRAQRAEDALNEENPVGESFNSKVTGTLR